MPTIEELEGLLNNSNASGQSQDTDISYLESLLPKEEKQFSGLQEITPAQQERLDTLRLERSKRDKQVRERELSNRGFAPEPENPNREESLLEQGIESNGAALRSARMKAGFASNPVPVIMQGLLSEFEGSTPEDLNLRYEPLAPSKELEKQIDNATLKAEASSEREIREREESGEKITQEIKNKIYARNLQSNLTQMSGLEMVYNNPKTGRITAVNPAGSDLGDLSELLGPSLPFLGEMGGGTIGAVVGSGGGIPGTVVGGGIGGAIGGGGGEAARLGIGRLIGVEPEEADFLDPVASAAGSGAFNAALGGGINALVARSIAKRVASGQFGMESARFARFLDNETFSKNSKAVERLNKIAKERGVKSQARPTLGQLSGDSELLDFERSLANLDSPITQMKMENGRFLDDVATSFNPKTGDLRKGKSGQLISRIASEIERKIIQREKEFGKKISESEAREVSTQVKNILSSEIRTDNSFAAQSLRKAAQDAEDTIFKERFGDRFKEIGARGSDVFGEPKNIRETAQEIRGEQEGSLFKTASSEERRFIDSAESSPDEISFENLSRDMSSLKEIKRKVDSGLIADRSSRTYARMIASGENDLQNMLVNSGRQDVLEDLLKARDEYGTAKKISQSAFGRMLSTDASGNFVVPDEKIFSGIVLNPSSSKAIKTMLIDAGLESQIPMIKAGIRDVYAKKFLLEGAEPNQLKGSASEWFNANEKALKQFFTDQELKAFKLPSIMAKREAKNRKNLALAQKKMRDWFGADLASTRDTPQEFMSVVFNKGTPEKISQLKKILPSEHWGIFKEQYKSELLSKIRSSARDAGFDINKIYANTGTSANPSSREMVSRATSEKIIGKKELSDLHDYAKALNILEKQGSKITTETTMDKTLKNIVKSFVKPLSMMSRRANALISQRKNIIEARMERALSDPKKLKKMIDAVNTFKRAKIPKASAIAFVEVLGSDIVDKLNDIDKEIERD